MIAETTPESEKNHRYADAWRRFLEWTHMMAPADDMDGTGARWRGQSQEDEGRFRASGSGVNFPTAIFIFMLAQLIGGIWWSATMQAKLDHEIADRARDQAQSSADRSREQSQLWQAVETYRLQTDQLRIEVARVQGNRSYKGD